MFIKLNNTFNVHSLSF